MMKTACMLCAVMFSLPAIAATDEDDDARFEESVRNFGFTSGAAHQCAEPAKRPQIESGALKAFSGLVRLFGTDHAFMYAAAFGAGTAMQIDRSKCPDYADSFDKSMNKHRSDR